MESRPNHLGTNTDFDYLEASPIAVVVVDEQGIIQQVNFRAEEIFGYLRTDMVGQPLEMLIPQRLRSIHRQHRDGYFHMPRSRPMGIGLELMGQRKDGSEFPVEVGLSQVQKNGQTMAISFISDISVRVQAAEALRQHTIELEKRVVERTQEIEKRRRVAEGLHDILTILNTARPLSEILSHIAERAHQLLGTDAVTIIQDERNGADPVGQRQENSPGEVTHPGSPSEKRPKKGRTAHSHNTVIRAGDEGSATTPTGRTDPYRSVLAVPLNVKGEVYGNISLYYRAARSFSREERELAVAFADQAALAIENSRLREQVEQSAVAAERSRLARDLHDAVTQTLFSTSLIAEVLPRLWERNPEIAMEKLQDLGQLTRGALAEMRTLLMELRPSALQDADLIELLKQLAAAVTGRARLPVTVEIEGERVLPPDVRVAFYRIAQEALNNVSKHSQAQRAEVKLKLADTQASLVIKDNGRGFDIAKVPTSHLGLTIMRERAEAIGADIAINSRMGRGTEVEVFWH
jgi:PAS domain S-box-containing protein